MMQDKGGQPFGAKICSDLAESDDENMQLVVERSQAGKSVRKIAEAD
jgi:hypothetical protein